MKTVNCYLVVDTQSVLQTYPNPSMDSENPTPLLKADCYLIEAVAGPQWDGIAQTLVGLPQATELERATPRKLFTFRSVSLSGNSSDGCVLYAVTPRRGAFEKYWPHTTCTLQSTQAYEGTVMMPLPVLENRQNLAPPQFVAAPSNDYSLVALVQGSGKLKIRVHFYITGEDAQTGAPVIRGYFRWANAITV